MFLRSLLLAAAFLCLAILPVRADSKTVPVNITTASGIHHIMAEVAATAEQRGTGLMYRRELAADKGMLFDFGEETEVSMWMRNTYIPLDMVFVRADGTVHRVEHDTTPFSETIIAAGAPVRYVVELAAGTARKLKIARGDKVESAAMRP